MSLSRVRYARRHDAIGCSPRELVGVGVEHRLHLGRQARAAPRRSRSRSRARRPSGSGAGGSRPGAAPSAPRSPGASGSALRSSSASSGTSTCADAERGRDRLARQVVRRAAEAAGDDQVVDARPLAVDERRRPPRSRPARPPASTTCTPSDSSRCASQAAFVFDDVAGDDLVPDREQSCAHPRLSMPVVRMVSLARRRAHIPGR